MCPAYPAGTLIRIPSLAPSLRAAGIEGAATPLPPILRQAIEQVRDRIIGPRLGHVAGVVLAIAAGQEGDAAGADALIKRHAILDAAVVEHVLELDVAGAGRAEIAADKEAAVRVGQA